MRLRRALEDAGIEFIDENGGGAAGGPFTQSRDANPGQKRNENA